MKAFYPIVGFCLGVVASAGAQSIAGFVPNSEATKSPPIHLAASAETALTLENPTHMALPLLLITPKLDDHLPPLLIENRFKMGSKLKDAAMIEISGERDFPCLIRMEGTCIIRGRKLEVW